MIYVSLREVVSDETYVFIVDIQVMESEEFLLLPVNQLVDIISSDELNVRSEEQVYNAVVNWVKFNIAERRSHLPVVSVSLKHWQYWF